MRVAMIDLAEQIAGGQEFDPFATDYYQAWKERKKGKWSEKTLRTFVQMKVDVMAGVKATGLKDLLIVQREGLKLSDGGHRLMMLQALGHRSAIVREI